MARFISFGIANGDSSHRGLLHLRLVQVLFLLLSWQIALVTAVPGLHLPIAYNGEQSTLKSTSVKDSPFLPDDVKPVHYNVTVQPHKSNLTFDGEVDIELRVLKTTRQIVLHVDELNITSQAVVSQFDIQFPSVAFDEKSQTITLQLSRPLYRHTTASIHLHYVGPLRTDITGFFASPYKHPDGTEDSILTTFTAPTNARRAFPCFDEPALKATFTMTIISDPGLTCLGNMPIAHTVNFTDYDGQVQTLTRFEPTPLMSTYLLTWAIGNLSYTEDTSARVPVRIYVSPADDVELTRYAAKLIARGITAYESLFGVEYSLPKLDLLAPPVFMQGGMEDWGLIVAHPSFYMFDEEKDGEGKREMMARLLIHELAHQWFGNLVTLQWWDQTWLNEGGATAVSMYCMQLLEPTWTLAEYHQMGMVTGAFGIDAYRSSHPIEVPADNPGDIIESFDQISYSKGGTILKMIREHLTPDVFFAAIGTYLKDRSFGNAVTEDLWKALGEASGEDVGALMDPWTKATGHPVVIVTEGEGKGKLRLEQHRFLLTGDVTPEEDEQIWPVFTQLRTVKGVDPTVFNSRTALLDVDLGDDDFFFLNANYTSLYRTKYTDERLKKLTKQADKGILNPQERAGLISDTCALAQAGYHSISTCLDLITTLASQDNAFVWTEIAQQVQIIREAWMDDVDASNALQSWYKDLASPVAHRLGWDFGAAGEAHDEQLFKVLMFTEAGMAGDEKILEVARDKFKRFVEGDEDAVDEPLQRGLFSMVLMHGGEEEYNAIVTFAKSTTSKYSLRMALQSLLATPSPQLVNATLDLIFSGTFSASDSSLALSGLRYSKTARDMIWDFTRDNWPRIRAWLPPGLGVLQIWPASAMAYLSTRKQMEELARFVEREDVSGLEAGLRGNLERVKGVVSWLDRDGEELERWLGMDGNDEL